MEALATASPAMSQVNARLSTSLKRRGDAALANAGITPSQAVRAVWEFAAVHANEPRKIVAALYPDQEESADVALERERKVQLVRQGSRFVEDALLKAGLSVPSALEMPSEEELRNAAFLETYGVDVFGPFDGCGDGEMRDA